MVDCDDDEGKIWLTVISAESMVQQLVDLAREAVEHPERAGIAYMRHISIAEAEQIFPRRETE